jgi:predicted nuclease of predicted toxin-antitoxin system
MDFNNMASLYGFPPKIIWIKKGNCNTRQIEALIHNHLEKIISFIKDRENGILILS